MTALMTFVKTDCPECSERILLDVNNGYGYCMYCGSKVEPEGLHRISSPLRSTLRRELECDDPYEGQPWYGDASRVMALLKDGDVQDSAELLKGIFESVQDDEARKDIADFVDTEIVEWIASIIDDQDPKPYGGRARSLYKVMSSYIDDCLPSPILDMAMLQLHMELASISEPDRAKPLLVTLGNIAFDYLSCITNANAAMDCISGLCTLGREAYEAVYSGEDASDGNEEPARFYKTIVYLFMGFIKAMEGKTQKDMVKVNRAIVSRGIDVPVGYLEQAYEGVVAGDMDACSDGLDQYISYMVEGPEDARVQKAKKRRARSPVRWPRTRSYKNRKSYRGFIGTPQDGAGDDCYEGSLFRRIGEGDRGCAPYHQAHRIAYPGTGRQEALSGHQAVHRAGDRGRILLRL